MARLGRSYTRHASHRIGYPAPFPITLQPTGISTAEAFGSATLHTTVTLVVTGIATYEAFGTPAVSQLQSISPTGIATREAFGTYALKVDTPLSPTGIATRETFGIPRVVHRVEVDHLLSPLFAVALASGLTTASASASVRSASAVRTGVTNTVIANPGTTLAAVI